MKNDRIMKIIFILCVAIVGLRLQCCDGEVTYFEAGLIMIGMVALIEYLKICRSTRQAEKERADELSKQTKREQEENALAHMTGLEKFHYMDVQDARKYQEGIAAMRELGMLMQQSVYQEKKKDWAVIGGITEGIAGPVAGVVSAANAIGDNARIEAENAARREWGAKQNAFYQDLARQAEKERPDALSMAELQKKYEAILSWSPATLFSMIQFSGTRADMDAKTGAVTVSTSWQQADKSLCVDGAFRAKLYTDSGACAGCAYLVLPKTGTVGFHGNLSGICASPKKSDRYTVKIEPVDLWELSVKDDSRSRITDYLTDYEHRNLVLEWEANYLAELKQ